MRKWMDKMERKFGRYAVKNLTVYLLVCYGVGYLLSFLSPQLLSYFTLEPGLILQGQIWRLISWVIIPPNFSLIFVIFMMLLYYSLGTSLETIWGSFRYNVYIFSGIIFTIIGAFIVYVITGGMVGFGGVFSTYYINMSIFFACAAIMPDLQLYLYGIIPVKMKWLAWVYLGFAAWDVITYLLRFGFLTFFWLYPLVPLLNYFLFFGGDVKNLLPASMRYRRPKQPKTHARPNPNWASGYHSKSGEKPYRHKCTVCGRTDTDYPNLEFRYCSKCNGYYCYCIDHINNHAHIQ